MAQQERRAARRWWRGELSADEGAFAAVLAVEYTFFLSALIVWLHGGPLSDSLELRIFVEAWATAPIVAFGAVLLVLGRGGRADAGGSTLALFAGGNALLLIAVAAALRAGGGAVPPDLPALRAAIAWTPIAANLLAALTIAPVRMPLGAARAALPVLCGTALVLLALPSPPSVAQGAAIAAASAGLTALPAAKDAPRLVTRSVDLAVVAAMAWLLFDPHLHYDLFHHNPFLGPVHDMRLGGIPTVDLQSQYGVLSIHAVAAVLGVFPQGPPYLAFAALLSILLVAQYAIVYALLRHLDMSLRNAVLAILAAFLFHFIGLAGAASALPSLGPMRFGLPWLLLVGLALRTRRPSWRRAIEVGETLVVASASLWSLETFVFTLATFGGVLVFESAAPSRRAMGRAHFASRLGRAVAAILAAHALFALVVLARAGTWPDWGSYLALVRGSVDAHLGLLSLGPGDAGRMHLVPATGAWIAVLIATVGSLFACLLTLPRAKSPRDEAALALVFGATLMAAAEFGMYVGASSPLRLASVAIAPVFVAAFWIDRLRRSATARFVAYAVTGLGALQMVEPLDAWIRHDSPSSLGAHHARTYQGCNDFPACVWTPPRTMLPKSLIAVRLLREHADGVGALLLLGGNGRATTEVLMLTGRRNALPLNAPFQDALVSRNARRIATAEHRLVAGDVVIAHRKLATARSKVYELERKILERVCREFVCREVERGSLFRVLRLEARASSGPE